MKDLNRQEIIVKYRERKDKFAYYLMGLNVAAIGFTLNKTYELAHFNLNHIFLGIGLLSWLVSILFSFRWILTEFQGMQFDMHQFDIDNNVIESWFESNKVPDGYKEAIQNAINADKEKKLQESEKDYKKVLFFFISGIVFFIFWRIMEITHLLQ